MYINWLYGYPIIPGLFLIHFLYCSFHNYSGIMCTCKPIPPTNYKNKIGCHMWQSLMLLCMCFSVYLMKDHGTTFMYLANSLHFA